MTTLTVQDMLWINLQLTKTSEEYHYARLEEATFYQFGYGGSLDLVGQAAKFATGFARMKPFSTANWATAAVGLMAFLASNGEFLGVEPGELASFYEGLVSSPGTAMEAIQAKLHKHEVHLSLGVPDKREAVFEILEKYAADLAQLMADEPQGALA